MRYDIGIGHLKTSSTQGDEIKTYALGSCVAVILYDRKTKIAGMIHIALPESAVNTDKAKSLPGYFVDTGLPLLLKEFKELGGDRKTTVIKIAGGSSIMDENKTFDIGKRNGIAVKRYLWKNGLGVMKEDIGGNISRTVSIDVDTGRVLLSNAKDKWEI
ncbi:MAG: chemotaxis protein CheD [Spirochaetia bacterium]|jgi:chemotaxis protein CheD|nr:chemotaxis protein CheD [Spirochaetia bacterium]